MKTKEKIPTIKFSHSYLKQPLINVKAKLLQVLVCDKEELSEDFIKYDTAYFAGDENGDEKIGYYPLPEGKLLVLILSIVETVGLIRDGWGIFTTIRRWTPQKERYYRNMQGKTFNLQILRHGK